MTHLPHDAPRKAWGWANPVFVALAPEHYSNHDNDGVGICPRWADHQDLVEIQDRIVFVAHPYVLDGEALDDFAVLRSKGWRIRIGGSNYYPGSSVRVSIERDGE